jgi:hypothetical protein
VVASIGVPSRVDDHNCALGRWGRLGDMSTSARLRTRFPSAVLVAVGLAAGFGVAQGTGVRALGGAVFAAAGLAAGVLWLRRRGPVTAIALAALYVGAFVLAHVLAIGVGLSAWLAVSLVTLTAAGVTFAVADASREQAPVA